MDIVKLLPEYLDGDEGQLQALAGMALRKRCNTLRETIADGIVTARAMALMDDLEGQSKVLKEVRKLKAQLNAFQAELRRLEGDDDGPDESG